jgi:hypothetical protein
MVIMGFFYFRMMAKLSTTLTDKVFRCFCLSCGCKICNVTNCPRSFSLVDLLNWHDFFYLLTDVICLLLCVTSILVTAFVGTAIAFGCFTCAAIVAKRREYLYLGGLLSSGLSILLWLQFAASIFGHSTGSFMFEVRYWGYILVQS